MTPFKNEKYNCVYNVVVICKLCALRLHSICFFFSPRRTHEPCTNSVSLERSVLLPLPCACVVILAIGFLFCFSCLYQLASPLLHTHTLMNVHYSCFVCTESRHDLVASSVFVPSFSLYLFPANTAFTC